MERWPYNYQVKEATGNRDREGTGPGWWIFYPPRGRKYVARNNWKGPFPSARAAFDEAEHLIDDIELLDAVIDDN